MAKFIPPRQRYRNRIYPVIAAAKRDAANAEIARWGPEWGKDFFSIPLYGGDKKVKEYAADCVLTDEQLAKLKTLPNSVLNPQDIEVPTTKDKGKAKLKEIAAKRNVEVKSVATAQVVTE